MVYFMTTCMPSNMGMGTVSRAPHRLQSRKLWRPLKMSEGHLASLDLQPMVLLMEKSGLFDSCFHLYLSLSLTICEWKRSKM